MIDGMFFHLSGKEMSVLMLDQAAIHSKKAGDLEVDLKEASEAMAKAREAGAKAGKVKQHQIRPLSYSAQVSSARGGSSPERDYGQSVEDPVSALVEAIKFHRNRATSLTFWAKHLLPEEMYKLREHDLSEYELLVLEE